MPRKKVDGMLANDGLKWDYGRKRPLPSGFSVKKPTSISEAQGRNLTVSKTVKPVTQRRGSFNLRNLIPGIRKKEDY